MRLGVELHQLQSLIMMFILVSWLSQVVIRVGGQLQTEVCDTGWMPVTIVDGALGLQLTIILIID